MGTRATRMTARIVRNQTVGWLSDRIHDDQRIVQAAGVVCVLCGRRGAREQFEYLPIVGLTVESDALAVRCTNLDNCTLRQHGQDPLDEEQPLPYATPLQVQRAQRSIAICINELRRRGFLDVALQDAGLLVP